MSISYFFHNIFRVSFRSIVMGWPPMRAPKQGCLWHLPTWFLRHCVPMSNEYVINILKTIIVLTIHANIKYNTCLHIIICYLSADCWLYLIIKYNYVYLNISKIVKKNNLTNSARSLCLTFKILDIYFIL